MLLMMEGLSSGNKKNLFISKLGFVWEIQCLGTISNDGEILLTGILSGVVDTKSCFITLYHSRGGFKINT